MLFVYKFKIENTRNKVYVASIMFMCFYYSKIRKFIAQLCKYKEDLCEVFSKFLLQKATDHPRSIPPKAKQMPMAPTSLALLVAALCGSFLLVGVCADSREVSGSSISQVRQALESLTASDLQGKGPDEQSELLTLFMMLSSGHLHLQCSVIVMGTTAVLSLVAVLSMIRPRQ